MTASASAAIAVTPCGRRIAAGGYPDWRRARRRRRRVPSDPRQRRRARFDGRLPASRVPAGIFQAGGCLRGGGLGGEPFPLGQSPARGFPFPLFADSLLPHLARGAGGSFLRGGGLARQPFPFGLLATRRFPRLLFAGGPLLRLARGSLLGLARGAGGSFLRGGLRAAVARAGAASRAALAAARSAPPAHGPRLAARAAASSRRPPAPADPVRPARGAPLPVPVLRGAARSCASREPAPPPRAGAGGRFLRGGLPRQPFPFGLLRGARASRACSSRAACSSRLARAPLLRLARGAGGRFLRGGLPSQPFPFGLRGAPLPVPALRGRPAPALRAQPVPREAPQWRHESARAPGRPAPPAAPRRSGIRPRRYAPQQAGPRFPAGSGSLADGAGSPRPGLASVRVGHPKPGGPRGRQGCPRHRSAPPLRARGARQRAVSRRCAGCARSMSRSTAWTAESCSSSIAASSAASTARSIDRASRAALARATFDATCCCRRSCRLMRSCEGALAGVGVARITVESSAPSSARAIRRRLLNTGVSEGVRPSSDLTRQPSTSRTSSTGSPLTSSARGTGRSRARAW